jgi:hypothetical protein
LKNKGTELFDRDSSSWNLEVRAIELRRVCMAFQSMRAGPNGSVWVQKVGPGTRRWFGPGFMCRAFIDTAAGPSDPDHAVAIPLKFLNMVVSLADSYGTATIYLRDSEGEKSLVARAGGEYLFVDELREVESPPPFPPMEYEELCGVRTFERVAVRADVLERISEGYMSMISSLDESNGPPAFLNLEASQGALRWTSDWTRWGMPRVSGYSTASTERGHFDLSFFPLTIFKFLSGLLFEEEVTFGANDSSVATVFGVQGLDWAVWSPVRDENNDRWEKSIREAFALHDFELFISEEDDWDPDDFWSVTFDPFSFTSGEKLVFAEVMEGRAGLDCIRLSTMLGAGYIESEALLRAVARQNEELTNARITVSDTGLIQLITDVDDPSGPESVATGLRSLLAAMEQIDGFDGFLPLFAANTDDPGDIPND